MYVTKDSQNRTNPLVRHKPQKFRAFIHYVDLYSASSRLLRSASDSSMAKKSSFKARVERVRVNPGEQSQCKWKPLAGWSILST